jgi:hypothetical protein
MGSFRQPITLGWSVSLNFFLERKQNMIEFSFNKFFQLKREVRVSGKKLGHEGSRASKGTKNRGIEKIECDQVLLQEVFLVQV